MLRYDAGERIGNKGYLRLSGSFLGDVSDRELARVIEHHYVDDGVAEIVVDLRDVDEISLEGVGILLRLLEESDKRGKQFVVEHPSEQVREKLAITGVLGALTED